MSDKKRNISDILRQEIPHSCFICLPQKRSWLVADAGSDKTIMHLRAPTLEHLMVLRISAGKFVPGVTVKSPSCVLHSNNGCVLCGHRAQLQGDLILGRVYGDEYVALEEWTGASACISKCMPQPLQGLSSWLKEPVPAVTTGCGRESRDSSGDLKGL
jgi:hypothetical protein